MLASPARCRILVIGEDELRIPLVLALAGGGHDTVEAADTDAACAYAGEVDLIVADLPGTGAATDAAFDALRRAAPGLPVIVVRGRSSIPEAVRLTRAGAADVVPKPVRARNLVRAVERVRARGLLPGERPPNVGGSHLAGFVGRSRPMRQVVERIERIGTSTAPVLVQGETGTGKELVALALHRRSGRGPFVPVNCSAIPEHLLESELFGYVRGAFTGSDRDKPGLFEQADGGTLFLDEIGELPLHLQPKLLRVLESGELRRLGEVQARTVAVRLIAATHRDLAAMAASGAFRQDLYWRIDVLRLDVPPLRERASDIPLLMDAFVADVARREGVSPPTVHRDALAALVAYDWPGNVRELRSAAERAVLLSDGGEIGPGALPEAVRGGDRRAGPAYEAAELGLTLRELEHAYVEEVLRRCGGNRSRAAGLLGIPRRTLYRRLDALGAGAEGALGVPG
jgi:DNA-binding NtrC family response regulator